jgi:hypothetical protein
MIQDITPIVKAESWGAPALASLMRQLFADAEPPPPTRATPRRMAASEATQSGMKVKATMLLSRRAMLIERLTEAVYEQFLVDIGKEIPFFQKTLLPSTQIPVADFLRFNDALVDRFFGADKRIYWTFGEQSSEWLSKNGPYVHQFKRGDFKRFWAILPALWKTFYSEGEARVSSHDESLDIEIDVPVEHVYFEYSILGFVKRGLELLGARLRVDRVRGFSSGDHLIHYRFTIYS